MALHSQPGPHHLGVWGHCGYNIVLYQPTYVIQLCNSGPPSSTLHRNVHLMRTVVWIEHGLGVVTQRFAVRCVYAPQPSVRAVTAYFLDEMVDVPHPKRRTQIGRAHV